MLYIMTFHCIREVCGQRSQYMEQTHESIDIEPAHEIMALFVLRKLILQARMCSHPVGLDVWIFRSDPSSTSILHVCEQRRLWRDCTVAGRLCDKNQNLMSWLKWQIRMFRRTDTDLKRKNMIRRKLRNIFISSCSATVEPENPENHKISIWYINLPCSWFNESCRALFYVST